ncbi:MAG: DUF4270 family protein [Bacteroidales bacterium]|nr:DUF4270 family protein [Bacteroidales bacterium]
MTSTFVNSQSRATYTDQIPIELSTFRLDSVLTSAQNVMWVGRCEKPSLGHVCSQSLSRMSDLSSYGWAQKEKYDSVTIVLRHTGDYQGDTMKAITIDVQRLGEPLQFAVNESYFYNVRNFKDSTSIGHFSFVPRPHSRPRLRYRLDDSFGEELVAFIKEVNHLSSDVASKRFESIMGGVRVTYLGEPEALLAFRADSMKITLHSHIDRVENWKISRTISLKSTSMQFNRIWAEDTESPFDKLTKRNIRVTEQESNSHSMMFEGLGYYTCINFSSLKQLADENFFSHVVKAMIRIYPERDTYDKHEIPTTFYLTEINRYNALGDVIYNSSGGRVSATLVNNIIDEDEVFYYADITYYINTLLASGDEIDEDDGLVITWGSAMSPINYNYMMFNGHYATKYKSILEVYYYTYDRVLR